jgi:hypothetical protein
MFDSKQTLTTRLTDAVDLMIDFATLGEYGLEPVGRARQGCADPSPVSRRPPLAPRTEIRINKCDLLQESGLCKPPTARVTQLRDLRGSGRGLSRQRGVRGASDPVTANGAA